MAKETVKLTEQAQDAVKNYLESRLGCYGVLAYKFEVEETPKYTFDYYFSQNLDLKGLGIFQHALKSCSIDAKAWGYKKKDNEVSDRHLIQCHLSYEHIGGGTNGCDMGIEFYVTEDGKITEVYRKK